MSAFGLHVRHRVPLEKFFEGKPRVIWFSRFSDENVRLCTNITVMFSLGIFVFSVAACVVSSVTIMLFDSCFFPWGNYYYICKLI